MAGATSQPENEADREPPSAPRLRELPEEDAPVQAADADEDEPQLKTPPPESGRQDVTPGPAATISEPDEDISITVTMEESEAPPPISPLPQEGAPISASAGSLHLPEVSGPQPRLALVSEPEIELHGMTPLSAISQTLEPVSPLKLPSVPEPRAQGSAGAPFRPQDIELAVPVPPAAPSVPSAAPSGIRPVPSPPAATPPPPPPAPASPFARTAPSVPDTKPSVSVSGPVESAATAPPVRLMAQPLADAGSGKPPPPVEVWASTFSPAALQGNVASFVGQNAKFEPKTFGELVRASIALGEENS
jgi:hypothetical protein